MDCATVASATRHRYTNSTLYYTEVLPDHQRDLDGVPVSIDYYDRIHRGQYEFQAIHLVRNLPN